MTSSDSETRARTTHPLSTTQGGSIDVRQGAPAPRSNQTLSARSETGNRRAPAPTPMWESPLTVAMRTARISQSLSPPASVSQSDYAVWAHRD